MSQLLASDIILHPKHPEGVTADLRTWPLLDSYGESALAQLLCMGILGPQPAASHAPGAVHRHQTPKHTLHFPYGNPCTMAKATLPSGMSIFSSANRFSKKWREFRMSTCHSNGNRNSDFKLSLAYTCLHLGFQLRTAPVGSANGHCVFS